MCMHYYDFECHLNKNVFHTTVLTWTDSCHVLVILFSARWLHSSQPRQSQPLGQFFVVPLTVCTELHYSVHPHSPLVTASHLS